MSDKKTDLTSPAAVAKSQKVYGGIKSGTTKDVTGDLKKIHGKG